MRTLLFILLFSHNCIASDFLEVEKEETAAAPVKNFTNQNILKVFQTELSPGREVFELPLPLFQTMMAAIDARHVIIASENRNITAGHLESSLQTRSTSFSQVSCDVDFFFEAVFVSKFSQPLHTVLLLCPFKLIMLVFKRIAEENANSRIVQYIVTGTEENKNQLLPILMESTQVAFISSKGDHYTVEATRFSKDNTLNFYEVLTWTSKAVSFKNRLFPSLEEKYADFGGRELTVACNGETTFAKLLQDQNGIWKPVGGVDFAIHKIIGDKLNYTVRIYKPNKRSWGGVQPDGSVTGLVGAVYHRKAHLAADQLAISSNRMKAIDYTAPYMAQTGIMVSRTPRVRRSVFSIVEPFNDMVWAGILSSVLLLSPIGAILYRMLKKMSGSSNDSQKSVPVGEFYFNVFRVIVMQGNNIQVKTSSLSFYFLGLYYLGLVLNAAYSGSLTAVLTAPVYEPAINTFEDVIREATDKNLIIIMDKGTSQDYLFKNATTGIYRRVGNLINEKSYTFKKESRFEAAVKGQGITLTNPTVLLDRGMSFGIENFHVGSQTYYNHQIGFGMAKGSAFKPIFDKVIIQLKDSGIIDHLIQAERNKIFGYENMTKILHHSKSKTNTSPINLEHLQGGFILLFFGCSIAVTYFVFEVITGLYSLKKLEQMTTY